MNDPMNFRGIMPGLNASTPGLSESQVGIITLVYYLMLLAVFMVFVKSLKRE